MLPPRPGTDVDVAAGCVRIATIVAIGPDAMNAVPTASRVALASATFASIVARDSPIFASDGNCLATAGCGLHPERAQPVVVQGHGMTRGDDRARW